MNSSFGLVCMVAELRTYNKSAVIVQCNTGNHIKGEDLL